MCLYYRIFSSVKLIYTKTPLISKILQKCPIITSQYYKPPFLRPINPLQLLSQHSSIVTAKYPIKVSKEFIGDCGVSLDWVEYVGLSPSKENCVLVILPGLTGGVKDAYVMNMCDRGLLAGYRVAIYQMRVLHESVKIPHSEGEHMFLIDDVDLALDSIIQKYSKNNINVKIFCVGFSYGANQIVRYLGDYNNKNKKVFAAVSISNPYDFTISSKLTENTIYDRLLLYFLQNVYNKIGPSVEKDTFLNLKGDIIRNTISLHEFDNYFTSRIFGYYSATDYYRKIGSGVFLKYVNVPLLIIHAMDDPVTNYRVIPYDDVRLNNNIVLLRTDTGTHSCFLEDNGVFGVKQWVPKPAIEFINAVNEVNEEKKIS